MPLEQPPRSPSMHDKRRWVRLSVEREELERRRKEREINARIHGRRPPLTRPQIISGARVVA